MIGNHPGIVLFSLLLICYLSQLSVAYESAELDELIRTIRQKNPNNALEQLKSIDSPIKENDKQKLLKAIEFAVPNVEWMPFLKKLHENEPNDIEYIYQIARAYWRSGEDQAAMEWGEKAFRQAQKDENMLYRVGALAYAANHYEKAQQWLEHLLDINPQHEDGCFLMGTIHSRLGKLDEAKKRLKTIVEDNPKHYMAFFELGKIANREGASQQAETYLLKALEGYPFFFEAVNALLVALARQEKKKELEKWKKVYDQLSQWDDTKLNRMWYAFRNPKTIPSSHAQELAMELSRIGRNELAERFLEYRIRASLAQDPEKLLLARLHFNQRKFKEALALVKQIQTKEITQSIGYAIIKSASLLYSGQMDESRQYYNKVSERFPDNQTLKALGKQIASVESEANKTDIQSSTDEVRSFSFVDRTKEAGLDGFRHRLGHPDKKWITDAMGSGVAVGDFDNDGDDDIYFVNGRPELYHEDPQYQNALFENQNGHFTDITEKANVGDLGFGMCALFGDIDNDGWLDLFIGNVGKNRIYKNNGDGTFTDWTEQSGIEDKGYAAAAAFADVDQDGDLDLYIGNYVAFDPQKHGKMRTNYYGLKVFIGPLVMPHQPDCLYINQGNGVFVDKADEAQINVSEGRAMGAVFFDLENDGDLDLYVANDSTYNHVLTNQGDGTFEDHSFMSGGAFTESGMENASMGVSTGDYNNDGFLDLFITSYERQSDVLLHNEGNGYLTDVTSQRNLKQSGRMRITWGTLFCDFDSDGWLDIFTANGHLYPQVDELEGDLRYNQGFSFHRNFGPRYQEITSQSIPDDFQLQSGRGAALLDYDQDGDMDVIVNNIDDQPLLLENRTPPGNWLQIKLIGTSAQCFGTYVILKSGDREWTRFVDGGSGYLSQNSSILHFGLGERETIDSITIKWPNQEPQVIQPGKINQRLEITHP